MKIKKQNVLRGLATCSKMLNAWHNCSNPTSTYKNDVLNIQEILMELLELKKIYAKKSKKGD